MTIEGPWLKPAYHEYSGSLGGSQSWRQARANFHEERVASAHWGEASVVQEGLSMRLGHAWQNSEDAAAGSLKCLDQHARIPAIVDGGIRQHHVPIEKQWA